MMTDYETIDVSSMRQTVENDRALVINVLGEDQFKQAHIPDSENVPESRDDFEDRVSEMTGSTETPIVVYCANDACQASPRAASRLAEAGFENVYDFEGGLEAWQEAGLDLEQSA